MGRRFGPLLPRHQQEHRLRRKATARTQRDRCGQIHECVHIARYNRIQRFHAICRTKRDRNDPSVEKFLLWNDAMVTERRKTIATGMHIQIVCVFILRSVNYMLAKS